ncbi:MAG: hypothetical protein V9E81_13790 [Marmoricola sp.]
MPSIRQVATASWRQRAWLLLRPVLPLIAAGVFLWKQWSPVVNQRVTGPRPSVSFDNDTLFSLLVVVSAGLVVNGLLQLVEWIHARAQAPASPSQMVVFVGTLVVSGLSAWGVHQWLAQTQPDRNDPMFSEPDGGSLLWGDFMEAYWHANTLRGVVIALIIFNIGVWIAIRWHHAADFKQQLPKHRASVAWASTGLGFIAALLLLPHHGWTPWWVFHPRPSWQPETSFPHLYLSSNWWPLTLVVLVAIHALTRLCLRLVSRNAVRRPITP